MADTVTPKLGLTKPEIGASNNTWGTKMNGNMDIIEAKMVRQTIQWTITGGDDNVASVAGPWQLTRWGNDGLAIDNPISVNRQTGDVTILKKLITGGLSAPISMPYQAAPAAPPAGEAKIYFDTNGNPVIMRPDGVVMHLGLAPGMITYTGGVTPDAGCAFLNGQQLVRADNPVLFARYGTIFNTGTVPATHFCLPDVQGRVIAHYDGVGRLGGLLSAPTIGGVGGLYYHYTTLDQSPTHYHYAPLYDPTHAHSYNISYASGYDTRHFDTHISYAGNTGSTTGVQSTGQYISGSPAGSSYTHGSGGANWHPNIQPTIILYAQVKLG